MSNKIVTICLFLLLGSQSKAQVTIGLDDKPQDGALLELRNQVNGTSTKGLGLPRVALTDRNNLTPMFQLNANQSNYVNAEKADEDKKHIGLIVYNIGNYDLCDDNTLMSGVYVWEGTKWQNIEGKEPPYPLGKSVEILEYKDKEYYTNSFGNAGRWMTEDLKAEKYDTKRTDGTIYANLQSLTLKLNDFNNNTETTGVEFWITFPYKMPNERIYNWQAASAGRVNDDVTITQLPEEGTKNQKKVQGICPAEWHLPTDYEFILLEKEILASAEKYSYMKSSELVSPTDFGGTGWRGEHQGTAMRNPCSEAPSNSAGPGKSILSRFGGFDAKLTGFYYTAGRTGNTASFYWTGSANIINPASDKRHAMYRTIEARNRPQDGTGIGRDKKEAKHFFSVRCVKDQTNDSNNIGWKE